MCVCPFITQGPGNPTAPTPPEISPAAVYRTWLDANAKGWESVAQDMRAGIPAEATARGYQAARLAKLDDPRAVVRMVTDIEKERGISPAAPAGDPAGQPTMQRVQRTWTTDDDREDRRSVAAVVDRTGLTNHAAQRRGSTRYVSEPIEDQKLDEDGLLGRYSRDGTITLHTGVRNRVRRAFERMAAGQDLDEADAYAAKVAIHEDLHGRSPLELDGYYGWGQRIEEVTTEILARTIVTSYPGGQHPWSRIDAPAHTIYQEWINDEVDRARSMGSIDPVHAVERASRRFKNRLPVSIRTPEQALAAWIQDMAASIAAP